MFDMTVLPMMKLVVETPSTSITIKEDFFTFLAGLLKVEDKHRDVAMITRESQSLDDIWGSNRCVIKLTISRFSKFAICNARRQFV